MKNFLKDEKARIPFSVIGIFLILGSSFTAAYVTRLERDKAVEIVSTIDFNEVENLIRFAEADMSTALNIAGLKGIKKIGITPVITAISTKYGDKPDEINKNVVREYIMDELNIYLTGNYLYNKFNDGKYAINIIIPKDEKYPIISWDDIYFTPLKLRLDRPIEIPILTPPKTVYHDTYWKISTPVNVEVKDLENKDVVTTRTVNISSIITSRYLLLKNLVDEFNKTINGINQLWSFTTIISNIYSLARGYQHFSCGKPENVVDNRHLALIVNSGLLLEQAFTFGSVDPKGIVDLGVNSYKTLRNQDLTSKEVINNDMSDSDEYEINTDDVSEGSANNDSGYDFNSTINQTPEIDLAEIAERVLYDWSSCFINFINPAGNDFTVSLEDPTTEKINQIVKEYLEKDYEFIGVEKDPDSLSKNQSTVEKINDIIQTMYSAEIKTKVTRPTPIINYGPHVGYPIDNGSDPWQFVSMILVDTIDKPPKGNVLPGSTLYGEIYDLSWKRNHHWSKNVNGNWSFFTATDTKFENDVLIEFILNYYSLYEGTISDVVDVCYYNLTLDDTNLEDTIDKYLESYYIPIKEEIIKTASGNLNVELINGDYNSWVETESWDVLNYLSKEIGKIKQDPSLNSTNYPNAFELLELIKKDLLTKYNASIDDFLNLPLYENAELFNSVGKKAVYFNRYWYVYKVREEIENVFESIDTTIYTEIDKAIKKATDDGTGADKIQDTLDSSAMDSLKNSFAIPLGFEMDLTREDKGDYVGWKEKTRLAVDQYPDYLDPYNKITYKGKEYTTLKLKNICTFGPTGLPILPPSPVTPWIITLNIWVIEVKGEYCEFKVIDSGDETIFNPIFGHDPQIYLRNDTEVYSMDGTKIGYNENIKFEFTTVAFSIVPPWGYMVGDFGNIIEETIAK